jgi:hypothetical protein
VPNPKQLLTAAAAQAAWQQNTAEQAMPYTITTPGTANSGAGNPLSFGQLDLSYPSSSGLGAGFSYYQGAAAQSLSGCSCPKFAEPPAVVLTAATATRSRANAVKLHNPAQLHGFMPTARQLPQLISTRQPDGGLNQQMQQQMQQLDTALGLQLWHWQICSLQQSSSGLSSRQRQACP